MDHGWIQWNLKTGTTPNLSLTIQSTTNGLVSLSWNASPGVRLQQCGSRTSPVWQDVPGTQGTHGVTLPPAESTAFFRLLSQ